MHLRTAILSGLTGLGIGVVGASAFLSPPRTIIAAAADRYQDYVIATGAVSINARIQTDGVWMLDYKTGKLLGTVIDKTQGKIVGWAEVDLAAEFEVKPLQDVHFMMTTGYITQGQSALYVAETTTGKFGVYTMGPGTTGSGIVIRRHDMTTFRQVANAAVPASLPAGPIEPAVQPGTFVPALPPTPPLGK